jgi:hypothetical protein
MEYEEQISVAVELKERVKTLENLLSKVTHDYDNYLNEMGQPPPPSFGPVVEYFKKYNPSVLEPTNG